MRQHFYTVPTGTPMPAPEEAEWLRHAAPGNPSVTMVVIRVWFSEPAQDAWEALPGIVEHFPESMSGTAGPAVITAFAPWGATTGMTFRQIFRLVRQFWPVWRD